MDDKLEFALSLIRSPFIKRISDRTFIQSVGASITALGGVIAIWRTPGVPVDQKVQVTMFAFASVGGVIAAWNASEKRKDTEIAKAVLTNTTAVPSLGAAVQSAAITQGESYLDQRFGAGTGSLVAGAVATLSHDADEAVDSE